MQERYEPKHAAVCSASYDGTPVYDGCTVTEDLFYGPDPYMADVWDDDTPVWLCRNCADERAMDI